MPRRQNTIPSAQAVEHVLEQGSHQGLHQCFPPARREGQGWPQPPPSWKERLPFPTAPLLLPCSQWSWFCSVRM